MVSLVFSPGLNKDVVAACFHKHNYIQYKINKNNDEFTCWCGKVYNNSASGEPHYIHL